VYTLRPTNTPDISTTRLFGDRKNDFAARLSRMQSDTLHSWTDPDNAVCILSKANIDNHSRTSPKCDTSNDSTRRAKHKEKKAIDTSSTATERTSTRGHSDMLRKITQAQRANTTNIPTAYLRQSNQHNHKMLELRETFYQHYYHIL
jgi:hypothetical protein